MKAIPSTRPVTAAEAEVIKDYYAFPFRTMLEEVAVRTVLFLGLSIVVIALIEALVGKFHWINYRMLLFILLILSIILVLLKKLKQETLKKEILSNPNIVQSYTFEIKNYIGGDYSAGYGDYLCEINDHQILFFMTDQRSMSSLKKKIQLDVITFHFPIVLQAKNLPTEAFANRIEPEDINMGLFEEHLETEFAILDIPFEEWYV